MAGGRPTKMTEETLKKLEDAYLSNATHLEAAIFAGISEPTLHDYRKKNPEYSKRIESLRGMTSLKAKIVVRTAIDAKDNPTAKWHLERTEADYNPKQRTEHSGSIGLTLLEQIIDEEGEE